ncbi:MAG: sodium:proton antiporter NhaD [Fibromonadales bacterium]|nr:sodium:proton antiporter NhaD [Fibromonadales bacterium]
MILCAIAIIFFLGYLAIAFEHPLKINKSATALLLGTVLWLIWFKTQTSPEGEAQAMHHLFETFGDLSQILLFLVAAMTIVAIIDMNDGFSIITSRIKTNDARALMWIISGVSFVLSAILDNLTTAIVMMTICRKLVSNTKERLFFAGLIIIAANVGGAWSPIGDVTTTMLWIDGQISALGIIKSAFLPSLVCNLVPLIVLSFFIKGKISHEHEPEVPEAHKPTPFEKKILFLCGLCGFLMVPTIKTIFHVPPYLAIFFVLGVLWLIVELLRRNHPHQNVPRLNLYHILRKVDLASILFFAGILLAIGCLSATEQLTAVAKILDDNIGDIRLITFTIGIFSAIIDNVPLVGAIMKMYPVDATSAIFRQDGFFWGFASYCAGTGGNLLVIGSAAGIAVMGMDKNLTFGWYLKRITPIAFLGYAAGAAVFLAWN